MNITELARILKINPKELRELLPQFGFDIGIKAIKIDNHTAQKIIKEWPKLIKEWQKRQQDNSVISLEQEGDTEIEIKKIKIGKFITVRDFAKISQIPISKILAELMKNGVFSSINEKIDFDTASVVGVDLNLDVRLDESLNDLKNTVYGIKETEDQSQKIKKIIDSQNKNEMIGRPPVIVVMGHVDHGKTKLLDAIRKADVVANEAGGITQHIGAYQVKRKNKLITFIDTPGHEAFTAMRSRGAKIADIAVLVVAADDGVKTQTIEAFRIIESSHIPYIIAINKIDKAEADINRIKQELSTKLNITPEDWGGKTVCVPISALKGEGVQDLLDMILLVAEMKADNIQANPTASMAGTIIESNMSKGAGPMVTMLVQNGVIKKGDQLIFNGMIYGKVKVLKNYKEEFIDKAEPSTPVQILGLKILPEVGDILEVGDGVKIKNVKAIAYWQKRKEKNNIRYQENDKQEEKDDDNIKKINIIIKSDVLGSLEAIEESLEKINTEDIKVKILHKGLGNITEGDIIKAEASNAHIFGFNVKIIPQLESLIREKKVNIKVFNIIYDLIKYAKDKMQNMLEPQIIRLDLAKIEVLAIFRTELEKQILGGKVISGKAEVESKIEIIRNKNIVGTGKLAKLQSGKQNVAELEKNQDCGIQYEGKTLIEKGDILLVFKERKTVKSID